MRTIVLEPIAGCECNEVIKHYQMEYILTLMKHPYVLKIISSITSIIYKCDINVVDMY